MIDGSYDVTLKILFTTQKGIVTLTSSGDACTATVEALGTTQTFKGSARGDSFSFTGELEGPTGMVSYEVEGTADGRSLNAQAKTSLGTLKITGVVHE